MAESGNDMAARIKQHHATLRQAAESVKGDAKSGDNNIAGGGGEAAVAAWEKMKQQDAAALRQYANDMHDLATKVWRHGENNNNGGDSNSINNQQHTDRLLYMTDTIEQYFSCRALAVAPQQQPAQTLPQQQHPDAPNRREREAGDESNNQVQEQQQQKKYETLPGYRLPGCVSSALKQMRKDAWAKNGAPPTDAECDQFALFYVASLLAQFGDSTGNVNERQQLRICDIGSCYNPLRSVVASQQQTSPLRFWPLNRSNNGTTTTAVASTTTLDAKGANNRWLTFEPVVVGLDLCPKEGSGVFQCDWYAVKVQEKPQQPNEAFPAAEAAASSIPPIELEAARKMFTIVPPALPDAAPTSLSITEFKPNSCHVVTFCLMLSYVPDPVMRLRCCFNALQLLVPNGLFVVVSTRTQCNRNSGWEEKWMQAIEALGFERFRKDIRVKLVGMAFRKISAMKSTATCFEDLPEKLRKEGLPIGADL